MFSKSKFVGERNDGLARDSGELYQTYFYQVLSVLVLEELQLCFRMLSLMGQQVWQTLL